MELKFTVSTKINKPVAEVFDAVVNPKKITGYFCEKSDGPLVEGKTVHWSWSKHEVPVQVGQIVPNEKIVFNWPAMSGGDTAVIMTFSSIDASSTMISVSESGWPENEEGLKNSYRNCEGWQHMISCLKAYLVHNIDLRK